MSIKKPICEEIKFPKGFRVIVKEEVEGLGIIIEIWKKVGKDEEVGRAIIVSYR